MDKCLKKYFLCIFFILSELISDFIRIKPPPKSNLLHDELFCDSAVSDSEK